MHIAVNLRQYFQGKIGGHENYVRHIVGGVAAHQERQGRRLTIFAHRDEVDNVRAFAGSADIKALTQDTAMAVLESEMASGVYDLLFCPLLVLEPLRVKIATAVTIPDIQHEFYPEFFDPQVLQWRRQNFGPSALLADAVFTVSEFSKQTIVDRYGADPSRIEVTYNDVDAEFREPPAAEPGEAFRALQLPARYVYYPANFWPHKNHANLLEAMRRLVRSGYPDLCLVLSGAPSQGSVETARVAARLGLRRNVRIIGYQPRKVVVEVYRNAMGLVFPSRFEGFGIPLLEAFHAGTPAVSASLGSCMEVAQNAAIYVDQEDPASIALGVERLLREPKLRQTLVERGRQRAALFTWQKSLETVLAAFDRIGRAGQRIHKAEVRPWPTVGIVTPSFNMGRFIGETMDSVLSQDYPHIDYVVMDGASRDNTVELLKGYAERYPGRIRWFSQKDRGQADAINRGYHNTRGELFTFLNADDTYLPGAVATLARHFRENPGFGLIYGEGNHVREDGSLIGRYATRPFDMELLNSQCFICQPAACMLREAFERAGMMNVNLHFTLDYDLWIRIAKLYPVRKVDDYIANSRMYRDNKTLARRRQVYQEILSAVSAHYGYVPYEWVHGYACYLIDGKDQFFDRSIPGLRSFALSLLLGSYYNRHGQLRRYWREWGRVSGISGRFTGRWDDGWISRVYTSRQTVGSDVETLVIEGKHWAPVKQSLTVKLDHRVVGKERLAGGPFVLRLAVPPESRGRTCRLDIETAATWRPMKGDYRRLGCLIDSIRFEPHPAKAEGVRAAS